MAPPNGVEHLHLFVEAGEHLVEVARLDTAAENDAAGVRLQFAEQAAEQRGLAAAVGAENAPFLAAQNVEREIAEQRLTWKRFSELLHAQDDVAGARGGRKTHRRHGDLARWFDPFDPLQFFAAVLGLLMPVAEVIA